MILNLSEIVVKFIHHTGFYVGVNEGQVYLSFIWKGEVISHLNYRTMGR